MLSEEGREAARDCLLRSGLVDSTENLVTTERLPNLDASNISDLEFVRADSTKEAAIVNSSLQKKTIDVPPESLDRVYIPFAYGYFFPVFLGLCTVYLCSLGKKEKIKTRPEVKIRVWC